MSSESHQVRLNGPDIAGIDEELAMNIANSFGAGMGNMEGTCGALVASNSAKVSFSTECSMIRISSSRR